MVRFDVTDEESAIVRKIVRRARDVSKSHGIEYSSKDISMDVIACHANGCRLDLQTLLDAPEDTFAHDIFGIRRFIDRTTGKINPVRFDPRCSEQTLAHIPNPMRRKRAEVMYWREQVNKRGYLMRMSDGAKIRVSAAPYYYNLSVYAIKDDGTMTQLSRVRYLNRYGWTLECTAHPRGLFRVLVTHNSRRELGSGPVETAFGGPWIEESVGKSNYADELKNNPLYHDKTPRRAWDQLASISKASWCWKGERSRS